VPIFLESKILGTSYGNNLRILVQVVVCLICGTSIKIIFTIGPDVLRMYISQPVVLPLTDSSLFLILKYLKR